MSASSRIQPTTESSLRRYNLKRQTVELRRPNLGKCITDSLTTVQVDPVAIDMYSEVLPLHELVGVMRDKMRLVTKIEFPKWAKRSKMKKYGWGVFEGILKMDVAQPFFFNSVSRFRENNLTSLKKEIKQFAESIGYICGFTLVDRRFISESSDEKFPFDTAVVLGMEMDKQLLDEAPHPGKKLFDFETYVESGRKIFDVAKFIRSKGYRCWARIPFDGWVKFPPHAINAGLGELGANGVVITPQFGPRQRWAMISIDADIEIDQPVDLGMAAYCDACRLCIKACPGDAIPEERIWWRGVLKRKINDTKCWPWFVKYEGCGICLKVCPINRFGYKECTEAFKRDGSILRAASNNRNIAENG